MWVTRMQSKFPCTLLIFIMSSLQPLRNHILIFDPSTHSDLLQPSYHETLSSPNHCDHTWPKLSSIISLDESDWLGYGMIDQLHCNPTTTCKLQTCRPHGHVTIADAIIPVQWNEVVHSKVIQFVWLTKQQSAAFDTDLAAAENGVRIKGVTSAGPRRAHLGRTKNCRKLHHRSFGVRIWRLHHPSSASSMLTTSLARSMSKFDYSFWFDW